MSENPWARPALCRICKDFRVVSKTDTFRGHDDPAKSELTPCPMCGDDGKRHQMWVERHQFIEPLPKITEKDLTDEERIVVKDWRIRGFHMMDCLRWIEGRRYDPYTDAELANEMVKE